MHKYLFTLLVIVLCNSFVANAAKITLSGKVENPSNFPVKITLLDNKELSSSELDNKGHFKMTVKIPGEGYYFLTYGRNTAYLYLHAKDELKVTFDANEFDTTLAYTGKGAARNNYLAKKSLVGAALTIDLEAFYKVDEGTYLRNIENEKNTYLDLLQQYEVESFFAKAEEKSVEYERLLSIQNYASNYKFYLGEAITPSEEFYAPISKVRLNREEDYNTQPYYRYLVNSIWSKQIEAAPDVDGMLDVLRKVPLRATVNTLLIGFYSKMSSQKERAKDYLDLIKKVTTYEPFIEASEKRYKEIMQSKGLTKGDPSPGFQYESIQGNVVSLSELKGKYVYIDVWATWCAPCIKQVPYLKELEARYHDKNIVFVSISVDKEGAKDTWAKMVKEKQLGGLQLFADQSFDSAFMDAFAVNSIPRFILIDPQGNIIDPEAPRPSFQKTKDLLDGLVE